MTYYEFYEQEPKPGDIPIYEGKGMYVGDIIEQGIFNQMLFKGRKYWIVKYDMTTDDYYQTKI